MKQPAGKKLIQVNVRMTEEDFALLMKAAEKLWPNAEMTRSGIVLSLAKMAARKASK
ncbi:MAG: hypothetical protein L0387_19625 [Acidobacteria bacterium]|nr:hypothetical protein [Acidobacteriota bacterium]MCI0721824.1 hypothetical protein [Acidobacteriota bacterium]